MTEHAEKDTTVETEFYVEAIESSRLINGERNKIAYTSKHQTLQEAADDYDRYLKERKINYVHTLRIRRHTILKEVVREQRLDAWT